MIHKCIFFVCLILTVLPDRIKTQEVTTPSDGSSVIKAPLVTTTPETFIDTLLVILQSSFYNNNKFQLDRHVETATVLGVNLQIQFDGELSVVQDMVEKRIVTGDGNIVNFDMTVKNIMVEKKYSVTSVEDPLYSSNGTVLLSVTNALFHTAISTSQSPYFVDAIRYLVKGDMNTTVIGEGIPLAEEIQQKLEDLVITEYTATDHAKYFGEIYRKLNDIFGKYSLILCKTCDILE